MLQGTVTLGVDPTLVILSCFLASNARRHLTPVGASANITMWYLSKERRDLQLAEFMKIGAPLDIDALQSAMHSYGSYTAREMRKSKELRGIHFYLAYPFFILFPHNRIRFGVLRFSSLYYFLLLNLPLLASLS